MNFLVKTFKSKTALFAYLLTVFGMLQSYLPQLQDLIPASAFGLITSITGIAVLILRILTVEPISEK